MKPGDMDRVAELIGQIYKGEDPAKIRRQNDQAEARIQLDPLRLTGRIEQ